MSDIAESMLLVSEHCGPDIAKVINDRITDLETTNKDLSQLAAMYRERVENLERQLAEAQKLRDAFRAELMDIVNSRMSEFDDHGEFFHWARNRARHALKN